MNSDSVGLENILASEEFRASRRFTAAELSVGDKRYWSGRLRGPESKTERQGALSVLTICAHSPANIYTIRPNKHALRVHCTLTKRAGTIGLIVHTRTEEDRAAYDGSLYYGAQIFVLQYITWSIEATSSK